MAHFTPEKVLPFGSLARGKGRWDFDAAILVGMHFEGRKFQTIGQIRQLCRAECPPERLVRRPEAIDRRDAGGAPLIQEALEHGEELFNSRTTCEMPRCSAHPHAMALESTPAASGAARLDRVLPESRPATPSPATDEGVVSKSIQSPAHSLRCCVFFASCAIEKAQGCHF